ncbi:hypothetical protein LPJ74_001268 [Coemansia sp. RSA 1843]|nr:hypothetical protein LPJ74_001268 [Coemansia sp. RSA 1843]
MPAMSAFQKLPQHIAEKIVSLYIHGNSIPNLSDGAVKEQNAWRLLYKVSYSWRSLALSYFCSEVEVNISPNGDELLFLFSHLPTTINLDTTYYRHTKKVTIILHGLPKSLSKSQCQSLLDGWPDNAIASTARLLAIDIKCEMDQPTSRGAAVQSDLLDWIAQRIPKFMPNLQEVYIEDIHSVPAGESALEWAKEQKPNDLFTLVFDKAKVLELDTSSPCLVPNDLYFGNNPGLTSLDYACHANADFLYFIIQKSVSTLRNLQIHNFPMESIKLLVLSDSGTPIVYPRLDKLVFGRGVNYERMRRARVDKSVAVFPRLRYLKWEGPYAFEDDTLFRGNNDTLEYLDFGVDAAFAMVVKNEALFPKVKYPKLCCIITDAAYSNVASQPINARLLEQFTANFVTSEARVFKTTLPHSFTGILDIIYKGSYAINLTSLTLEASMPSLLQIIEIIRLLPNMSYLKCYFEGIDEHLYKYPDTTIIDGLYEKYYPLSNRFKHWSVDRAMGIPIRSFATSAITITLLCPNFIRLLTPYDPGMELQGGIMSAIASEYYDKHAERTTEDERLHWITKHIQTSMPKLQEVTITDCGHYNRRVGEPAYYRWKCASILESLKLIDAYLENARSFFFDSKNRPIVYPRLHKLEFYSGEESELDKPPRVDKSIAPFPVLRYLKWRSVYIFKDDTLFRGNSGTLEYLDIEVGTRLDDVIRDYSVFADGKYSRICHVSVRKADVYHVNSPSLGELMKIANGIISPKTMSIVLEHDFLEEDDIGILCECPYLENIQALNLGKTELELKDLVKLVKVFPNMTTLICTPGTIDFEPYSLLLSNFISDLYEEHYPLSQRLRRWHAVMDIEESAGLAVPSAILLAIICPNFVLASVPSEHLYMFNSVIKIAIKLGFYSDHINKIRRLLPNTD